MAVVTDSGPTTATAPSATTAPAKTATTTPTTTTPSPSADDSARAWLVRYFRDLFGGTDLDDEASAAYDVYLRNDNDITVALEYIRGTAGYKARFGGMAALREKGRPINEAQYLDLERSYTQIARQFDLPPGFYDEPSDFARLIGGEVSPVEWQRRLATWQTYERESRDPLVAEEIARQFAAQGLPTPTDGDYLATIIDPDRSLSAIERRLEAGRVASEARRSGYGALSIEEGLSLADSGVTREQAREGFDVLSGATELFGGLAGEAGADVLGREDQLGAVFQGDAASRRRIEKNAKRRQAEFAAGGGGGVGRSGLAGLG